jgi:uncharacterized protein YlxP (DUF503 family)
MDDSVNSDSAKIDRTPERSGEERSERKVRKPSNEQMQDLVDKFNLSVSEIAKHDLSYQDVSVLGLDGLLKDDDINLNSKIKLLEDKIKQLEI